VESVIGYSLIQMIIFLVVICAVVGIAMVAIRQSGVNIPSWVFTISWIVVVACVAIFAIKFLAGMALGVVMLRAAIP
jgi:hypothetical protein